MKNKYQRNFSNSGEWLLKFGVRENVPSWKNSIKNLVPEKIFPVRKAVSIIKLEGNHWQQLKFIWDKTTIQSRMGKCYLFGENVFNDKSILMLLRCNGWTLLSLETMEIHWNRGKWSSTGLVAFIQLLWFFFLWKKKLKTVIGIHWTQL